MTLWELVLANIAKKSFEAAANRLLIEKETNFAWRETIGTIAMERLGVDLGRFASKVAPCYNGTMLRCHCPTLNMPIQKSQGRWSELVKSTREVAIEVCWANLMQTLEYIDDLIGGPQYNQVGKGTDLRFGRPIAVKGAQTGECPCSDTRDFFTKYPNT